MSKRPADIVFVLDSSISMGKSFSDFRPSKVKAAAEIAARISRTRIFGHRDRVGVIIFYAFVVPLLHPTSSYEAVVRTLSRLGYTGEGSALGDAIIEAVKMLRRTQRPRLVVVFSDGELNVGSPLELAALYASNSGVRLCIATIGYEDRIRLAERLRMLQAKGLVEWRNATSMQKLESETARCIGGILASSISG